MKASALTFLALILSACLAFPRGEYYTPVYPKGSTTSATCDHNGNRVNLELDLNESVGFSTSLNNNLVLSLAFFVPPKSKVEIHGESIKVASGESKYKTYSISEWGKNRILIGGENSLVLDEKVVKFRKEYSNRVTLGLPHKNI